MATSLSGFSFIRNGVSLDYPFVEAYRSILPLIDELVVAVGDSTDGTRDFLAAFGKAFAAHIAKTLVVSGQKSIAA